ncbi:Uma2 family endonuclease [Synechocystis sp. LKSZ1]|uniref:Uma2 family endonuclease n=1 Tax=Synechocystis sp. LKSZ1 TaxID=3144951 RepID=UPI00336C2613
MIAHSSFPAPMSPEAYLAWEEQQDTRYEYIDGAIIAMVGGTIPHNDIAINLLLALRSHLQKRGCRVNMSDVKVRSPKQNRYFYPDLVVSCHPDDQQATKWIQHPKVMIEVLSPSTASYDRTHKLRCYRQLPSLQEYLLINTDQILVEMYQRQSAEMWGYRDFESDDTLLIASIDFACPVTVIYENVTLETLEEETAL